MTATQVDVAFFVLDVLATSGTIFTGMLAAYLVGAEQALDSRKSDQMKAKILEKAKEGAQKVSLQFFLWLFFMILIRVAWSLWP